jgi:hypothetical protein
MEVDLSRPPIRPVVPIGGWATFATIWAADFAYAVFLVVLLGPGSEVSVVLVVVFTGIGIVLGALGAYSAYRLGIGYSVGVMALAARRGSNFGNPEPDRRRPDDEEMKAYRRFARGQLSRVDYEKIVAHRQFVHGELTELEYHHRLQVIADQATIYPKATHRGTD